MTALQQQLFDLQDLKYRDFHAKLLPGIDKETIIGIRTPILRKFAKDFAAQEESAQFLHELLAICLRPNVLPKIKKFFSNTSKNGFIPLILTPSGMVWKC